jgi:hypothetical protein
VISGNFPNSRATMLKLGCSYALILCTSHACENQDLLQSKAGDLQSKIPEDKGQCPSPEGSEWWGERGPEGSRRPRACLLSQNQGQQRNLVPCRLGPVYLGACVMFKTLRITMSAKNTSVVEVG